MSADIDNESTVFKKRSRFHCRKRKASEKDDAEAHNSEASCSSSEDETAVVRTAKSRRGNPMIQSTGTRTGEPQNRQRRRQQSSESSSDETDHVCGSSANKCSSVSLAFEASKATERTGPRDMGATAVVEIDTELDKDAQTIFERTQQINKEQKGKADDKVYRGLAGYATYIDKRDTAAGNASSGLVRKGPVRAPNFLRQTVRWDYQPDICKDYKETGFCGFGDSCKFMHDRSDYKHGWELEREWKEGSYGKRDATNYEINDLSDDDDDALPFKCLICRQSFKNPVVTKCKHYFCEHCALEQFRKSQRCVVCGKPTGGVFKPAKEILARLGDEERKQKSDMESSLPVGEIKEEDDDDDSVIKRELEHENLQKNDTTGSN